MSNPWAGYDEWRMRHNPNDDYDNDAVIELIRERVEDEYPEWNEAQVAEEVQRRFEDE